MSKPELVAIYRLEFYKKQKNWKLAHTRESKKKSAKVKKKLLDTTYDVREGTSRSLHNEAFLETGPTSSASDLGIAVFEVTHTTKDAEPVPKDSQPLTRGPQKTVPNINQDINSNYVDINSNYSSKQNVEEKIIPPICTRSRMQAFFDAVKNSSEYNEEPNEPNIYTEEPNDPNIYPEELHDPNIYTEEPITSNICCYRNNDWPECDSVFYTNPVVTNEVYSWDQKCGDGNPGQSMETDVIWPPQFAPEADLVTVSCPDEKQNLLLQDVWIQLQGAAGIDKPNGVQQEYPFQQPSEPQAYPERNPKNPQYLGNYPTYRQQYGNTPPYPKDPQHLGSNQPYPKQQGHNPRYPNNFGINPSYTNDQNHPQCLGNNSPYLQQLDKPPYLKDPENPPYPQKMDNTPLYQQSGNIPAYPDNTENLQNSGNNLPYPQQLGNNSRYPNVPKYPQFLGTNSPYPQKVGNARPYQPSGIIPAYPDNLKIPQNMGNSPPYPQKMGNTPPYQKSGNDPAYPDNPEIPLNMVSSPYPQKVGNTPPYQPSSNIPAYPNNPQKMGNTPPYPKSCNVPAYPNNPQKMGNTPPYQKSGNDPAYPDNPEILLNMGNSSPYPQKLGNTPPYQKSGNIPAYPDTTEIPQNMGDSSPYSQKMGNTPPYQKSGNFPAYPKNPQNMGNIPMYQQHLKTDPLYPNNAVNPNYPPNEPKHPQDSQSSTKSKPDENFLKNLLKKRMDQSLNMDRTSEFGGVFYDQGPKSEVAMSMEWDEEFCGMSGAHGCVSWGSLHSEEFMLGAQRAAHSSEVDLARLMRATPAPLMSRDVTCPGRGRGRLTARDREAGLAMLSAGRGRM